jgi:hypothetical protein
MTTSYGPGIAGQNTLLNVTATTVAKASAGVIYSVSVNTAGSAAGGVYDAATTSGNVAANLIAVIPSTVSTQPISINFRCLNGVLIVPPTGGSVSVSFL